MSNWTCSNQLQFPLRFQLGRKPIEIVIENWVNISINICSISYCCTESLSGIRNCAQSHWAPAPRPFPCPRFWAAARLLRLIDQLKIAHTQRVTLFDAFACVLFLFVLFCERVAFWTLNICGLPWTTLAPLRRPLSWRQLLVKLGQNAFKIKSHLTCFLFWFCCYCCWSASILIAQPYLSTCCWIFCCFYFFFWFWFRSWFWFWFELRFVWDASGRQVFWLTYGNEDGARSWWCHHWHQAVAHTCCPSIYINVSIKCCPSLTNVRIVSVRWRLVSCKVFEAYTRPCGPKNQRKKNYMKQKSTTSHNFLADINRNTIEAVGVP